MADIAAAKASAALDDPDEAKRIIAARASVKKEILEVVEPYRNADTEPPFTTSELIVMAILSANSVFLTRAQILQWIMDTFEFHHHVVTRDYFKDTLEARTCDVDEAFEWGTALRSYDVPLIEKWVQDPAKQYPNPLNYLTVPIIEGRHFLSRVLDQPRKGAFDFLNLPAELRVSIYEMVLSVPGTRIYMAFKTDRGVILIAYRRALKFSDLYGGQLPYLDISSPKKFLGLLQVSKQINQEALPCFFHLNQFTLSSTRGLFRFLSGMSMARRAHLTDISFFWDTSRDVTPQQGDDAFKMLAQCKKLKRLNVDIDWPLMDGKQQRSPDERMKTAIGINFLTQLELPGLEFKNECGHNKDFIAQIKAKMDEVKIKRLAQEKLEHQP